MAQSLVLFLSVLFSLITPGLFVAIRQSVKYQRQEIIRDLSTIFAPLPGAGTPTIPSFEFVKYKYFFERPSLPNHPAAPRDFSAIHWVIGAIPLAILLFFLNITVLTTIIHVAFGFQFDWGIRWLNGAGPIPMFVWVVVAAYCGAYLFMIRAFFTAINNFDLSPASFAGAFVGLLTGILIPLIFVFGLQRTIQPGHADHPQPILFAAVMVSAFAAGYLPNVALRNVVRASSLRNYKTENVALYRSFSAIPVEIIDGIDTEIRDRLADFHINTVQNLAAANPLMLFVETPYGVYQILDWVAQAQLCCSVGPPTLLRLWQLGIRTIFDLERVALDPACRNATMLAIVADALFADLPASTKAQIGSPGDVISANILLRLNDSHVHRLRQLYNQIGEKLGNDSRRLRPVLLCQASPSGPCPFVQPFAKAA